MVALISTISAIIISLFSLLFQFRINKKSEIFKKIIDKKYLDKRINDDTKDEVINKYSKRRYLYNFGNQSDIKLLFSALKNYQIIKIIKSLECIFYQNTNFDQRYSK
ncbi:MAG: hypothetical protein A2086_13830 [Spirochaetes bacterium GWD1_27_9]|nr:MAG: hypothetical protein A2Z98_17325 [Spirochaetes bacterium GWB1_27_13]OHD21288.1 MAG: hypothetical protein A2Y34_06385 [Spirochaetes bacterium GWC1_27_15]OHD41870.1 MAG: hypothetical protein A2086_13830 [Spirochaetes bacterium GWD1_27_9]